MDITMHTFTARLLIAAAVLTCAGCAARGRVNDVDVRQFLPDGAERTQLQPGEQFLMPVPIDTAAPGFPSGIADETMSAITVCTEIVVGEEGTVTAVAPLHEQEGCAAGSSGPAGVLMAAAVEAVGGWTFFAAGICKPATPDDERCEAPGSVVRPISVKLAYAFTFERSGTAATVRAKTLGSRRIP